MQGDFRNYYRCCGALSNNPNAFGVETDGVVHQFDVPLGSPTSTVWQQFSFSFIYGGNSPVLRLTAERNGLDVDVAVDNIRISDVPPGGDVPEPSTLARAGAGLLALVLRSSRRS